MVLPARRQRLEEPFKRALPALNEGFTAAACEMKLLHVIQRHGFDCACEIFQADQLFKPDRFSLIVTAGGLISCVIYIYIW